MAPKWPELDQNLKIFSPPPPPQTAPPDPQLFSTFTRRAPHIKNGPGPQNLKTAYNSQIIPQSLNPILRLFLACLCVCVCEIATHNLVLWPRKSVTFLLGYCIVFLVVKILRKVCLQIFKLKNDCMYEPTCCAVEMRFILF